MICEKCGATMDEGVTVCPVCGWTPEEAPAEAPEAPVEALGPTVQLFDEAEEAAEAPVEALGPTVQLFDEADETVEEAVEAAEEAPEAVPLPDELIAETPESVMRLNAAIPSAAETAEPPKKKSKAPILIAAAVAALVVAGIVIALCLFAGKSGPSPVDRVMEMVECLPENEVDVAMETIGVPGDSVLLTVNGTDVTAQEYLYWLGNITSYYDMLSSYSGQPMDLAAEVKEGTTWDEQLKASARDNVILLALVPELAREYGAELTDEDLQGIVDAREASIQAAGGETIYAYQLQAMGISDAAALRANTLSTLYNKFQDAWLEKTAGELTDEEVAGYVEENDLLRAKHILLMTQDPNTGEMLDEVEVKARAQAILDQLRADPSQFDRLMEENSQDTGLSAYPDGYVFSAGDMVPEFESGTRGLGYGEISDLVQSTFGYHIILRLDPDSDQLRQQMAYDRYEAAIQERVNNAKVVESEAYQNFTTQSYYGKLLAFQATLPVPETPVVADQSAAELEPAP